MLQNVGAVNTKQEHSHDHLRRNHSRKGMPGLTRKWKSEYYISLMGKNEESDDENATETMNWDQHNEKLVRQGNKKTITKNLMIIHVEQLHAMTKKRVN